MPVYEVEFSRWVHEIGGVEVEADNHAEAVKKAREAIRETCKDAGVQAHVDSTTPPKISGLSVRKVRKESNNGN